MQSPHRVLLPLILLYTASSAAEFRATNAAELGALHARLQPGDTITLADGTWADQAVVLRTRGTAEKPITLRAATPGAVVLTGKSTLVIDGEWLVVSSLVVKGGDGPAEGIAIKGAHNRLTESAMIGGTYKHFLRMWGTDSRVDHCYFAGKTSGEPTFQVEVDQATPNRHRIDHNHFGPRPPLGRNGGETMRLGYSGQSMWNSRTLVEQNLFDRCDGEIEIISSKSCENIYRANTFLDCAGMLTLRHGNRCVIEGNFFLGRGKKGSGGVRVIGEDHVIVNNYIEGVMQGAFWITCGVPHSQLVQYFQARRCTIAFNTVVDSQGPYLELDAGINGSGRLLRPAEITVANNLFAVPPQGTLLKGTEGEYWRWAGNFVAGATTDHTGLTIAELKLVRGADHLWRPAADSPARGAADEKPGLVKTDIDGQPRTGKLDAGCDQAADAPVVNRPLTAADVGPAWLKR
ncbi:MAG: right-handed parallel beta-helix repeat-containing protein [Verrucomicrobia bacterium]|nr:right-handed parallel beta-helix repeat-containing protein [Verrucomicrobiota bacterium]